MTYSQGLAGVVAGLTAVSQVDGNIGRLTYRGYDIKDLVAQDYEDVMWLVLFGDLPDLAQKRQLGGFLRQGKLSAYELQILQSLDSEMHPMLMLQAMLPLLTPVDTVLPGLDAEANHGLAIIAKLPMLLATYRKLQLEEDLPIFRQDLAYLTNFLQMFRGEAADEVQSKVFKVIQILQMEHGFNVGTFTARVVASTLAPIASVLAAAIGALFGRLHGGADEAAFKNAKAVGHPAAAGAYIDDLLAKKGKLMGMGHREYRTVDPRSKILQPLAEALCKGTVHENTYLTLQALEARFNQRMQAKGKDVWANLEFYKGSALAAIGIPAHFFTTVFAMSRALGWLAHFIESRVNNRLIRPRAEYVGEAHRQIVRC